MYWLIEWELPGGIWAILAHCTTHDGLVAVVSALSRPDHRRCPVFRVTRIDTDPPPA
jgi:hypothetical protein